MRMHAVAIAAALAAFVAAPAFAGERIFTPYCQNEENHSNCGMATYLEDTPIQDAAFGLWGGFEGFVNANSTEEVGVEWIETVPVIKAGQSLIARNS